MLKTAAHNGFSLIEILVSLLVVSLTAVNITGLQKLIVEQNRDNVAHTEVISLANQKMNELLTYDNITKIDGLAAVSLPTETPGMTSFDLAWGVTSLDPADAAGADIRNITLQIDWDDSKGDKRTYTYSEQVNLALLLSPYNDDPASRGEDIVESVLETNNVIYFEAKMGYKKDAFVIYNSELFQATTNFSAGGGQPRNVANPTVVSDGWKSYGSINNPDLANNSDLATLFLDP